MKKHDQATEEIAAETVSADNAQGGSKPKKGKKEKKRMSKKKKIILGVSLGLVGVIVLSLVIWVMVLFLSPGATMGLSTADAKIAMGDDYYLGTENNKATYATMFPGGSDFALSGNKLTFKLDGKSVSKNVTTIDGGVNVYTWDELVQNINAGKKVVLQSAEFIAPDITGWQASAVPSLTVVNDVYGNGAKVNLHNLVVTREKGPEKNDGLIAKATDGLDYKKGTYEGGYTGFKIAAREDDEKTIFQDVHITGNDLDTAEGGNLEGITQEDFDKRGVKLFSGYGALLDIGEFGTQNEAAPKTNVKVFNCIVENGHKTVHVVNSNLDIENTIIRNASDTALSVQTSVHKKSVINSKNNVIAQSLTGGILFYCNAEDVTPDREATTWNELNVSGFLDIYNWKNQDGLAFLPETEGQSLANLANKAAGSEITKDKYNNLKAKVGADYYLHFGILKIKTGAGASSMNGSTVTFIDDIGYTTSAENGMEDGFPVPSYVTFIMKGIDLWSYYGNGKGSVTPRDSLDAGALKELYETFTEQRATK